MLIMRMPQYLNMASSELHVMSWNVNSVRKRAADIHYYITKHSTDIILLQESGDRGDGATLCTPVSSAITHQTSFTHHNNRTNYMAF